MNATFASILKSWLPALVVGLVVIGYQEYTRPRPTPVEAPLVAAAKQYKASLGDAFHDVAGQVKSGTLTDKASVVKALEDHARPLATALDTAFAPLIDKKSGTISNPQAASDMLEQAAKVLGGK